MLYEALLLAFVNVCVQMYACTHGPFNNKFSSLILKLSQTQYDYSYSMNG